MRSELGIIVALAIVFFFLSDAKTPNGRGGFGC
jgi:hypothetical protein